MRLVTRSAWALCLGALAAQASATGATQPGRLGALDASKIATEGGRQAHWMGPA